MRILHFLQSNTLSGAENVVADICMIFKGKHDMIYSSPDGNIAQALKDRDVAFLPLKKCNIYSIKKAINEVKPDLIHAHGIRTSVLCAMSAGKIPVVSHIHGNAEDMRTITVKSLLYGIYSFKFKRIITVSQSCIDEFIFKKLIEKKSILLTNILYMPRMEKLIELDEKAYTWDFMYLGRLVYQKNPQRVAKIASNILKKNPSFTFGVVGTGELRNEMEEVFKTAGVMEQVVFTGNLSHPYKTLSNSKCMLMCSRSEGTPIAVLEALSLGVPLVSTKVDGIVKLIENGFNGILTDNDFELEKAVTDFLVNPKYHRKFCENAKASMLIHNNWEKYMYILDEVYSESIY